MLEHKGIMGEGMAGRLLQGGRHLVVWNRGAGKCAELQAKFPELVTIVASAREVLPTNPGK